MYNPNDPRTEEEVKSSLLRTLAMLRLAFELAEATQENSQVGLAIVIKKPGGDLGVAVPLGVAGLSLLQDAAQLVGYTVPNSGTRNEYLLSLVSQQFET